MAKGIELEIVSPEGRIFKDTVDQVNQPASVGELTILPDHEPLFTSLGGGEVVIKKGSDTTYITVAGGFLEVSENKVNILASHAIKSDEIIAQEAVAAKKKAEEALKLKQDKIAVINAEKELLRSTIELRIADKMKKRPKKTG